MQVRKLIISRKVKTVNDLLARSDVNDVLEEFSTLPKAIKFCEDTKDFVIKAGAK